MIQLRKSSRNSTKKLIPRTRTLSAWSFKVSTNLRRTLRLKLWGNPLMSNIDALIEQAEADIKSAKHRLDLLKAMKVSMGGSEEFVSVSVASEILGISERTVRAMLREGKLRGYKLSEKCWKVYSQSIKEVCGDQR